MKIVLTDADTVTKGDLSFDFLEKLGEVTYYGLTSENEVKERVKDADIVICNKTPMNRSNLEGAKNLKYIGLFATGYNNIDIEYCRERGIAVCNAPAYSTDSVAQLAFALILEIVNRVRDYRDLVDKGDWIKSRSFSMFPIALMELKGKTLGIIGYGSIGEKTAEIAHAFGMRVIAYNRSPKTAPNVTFTDLDTLFRESDTIAKMKNGAILINTARGPIVDEQALAEALKSGKLLAAGVDVLQTEPMTPDCPLYGIENCIITPHIAWAALETRERLLKIVGDNLEGFLRGEIRNNVAG